MQSQCRGYLEPHWGECCAAFVFSLSGCFLHQSFSYFFPFLLRLIMSQSTNNSLSTNVWPVTSSPISSSTTTPATTTSPSSSTSTSSALADLLLNNLKTNKTETQTFLDRKLVVTLAHKPVMEIQDILTWAEALTIYLLVLCASQPLRWADVTL